MSSKKAKPKQPAKESPKPVANVQPIQMDEDMIPVDLPLRADGRSPGEMRKMYCKLGVFSQADGSAYLEIGQTRVLAAVYGPHEIKGGRGRGLFDRCHINCQYSQATFSTWERKNRPRGDYKSLEMTAILKQIFDSAILTELYPHAQIDIFVEVLQSDGSNYSACINAASLAVIHAGIPIKDMVCASSAGLINGKPAIDISYNEEITSGGGPIVTVAILPKSRQILSLESTGRVHIDLMEKLIDTAIKGCELVHQPMKVAVLDHVGQLTESISVTTTTASNGK